MMLFDTHALVWWRADDPKLNQDARERCGDALWRGQLAVCAVSFFEVGMMVEKGRIVLPTDLRTWRRDLLREGLIELPVDGHISVLAKETPGLPSDPMDQLIMATALNRHTLVTADEEILAWHGPLERVRADD